MRKEYSGDGWCLLHDVQRLHWENSHPQGLNHLGIGKLCLIGQIQFITCLYESSCNGTSHTHIVYGCFPATVAELSSSN